MQVDGGVPDVGMAEESLQCYQIASAFQAVGGKTVPHGVWAYGFSDASPFCSLLARFPSHFCRDGLIGPAVLHCAREQVRLRTHPSPVFAQRLQQLRIQRNIPVAGAFAEVNVNDHPCTVDVAYLEIAQLGAAHTGRVKRHHHGAMEQIAGGVDQPGDLLHSQDCGKPARYLWIRQLFNQIRSFECLDEEEAQGSRAESYRCGGQLFLFEQIRLIRADVFQTEPVGWCVEMLGKSLYRLQVRLYGSLRVISTLEFLQHDFAKLGHRTSL